MGTFLVRQFVGSYIQLPFSWFFSAVRGIPSNAMSSDTPYQLPLLGKPGVLNLDLGIETTTRMSQEVSKWFVNGL